MEQSRSTDVRILVPQHVSAILSPRLAVDPFSSSNTTIHYCLHVWERPGIAWRGLVPLLLDSPPLICHRLLRLFLSNKSSTKDGFRRSSEDTKNRSVVQVGDEEEQSSTCTSRGEEEDKAFWTRQIRIRKRSTGTGILLSLHPPTVVHPDYLFASVIIRTEHSMIRKQTLTAWWSTLGGGYFFCKRLGVSLQLARQQRILALQIGNQSMAKQCQINEAYNLIYAGKFRKANQVLTELEKEEERLQQQTNMATIMEGGKPTKKSVYSSSSLTWKQCQAARLFAKRLRKVRRHGLAGYHTKETGEKHTVDDFQRIRIVES